MALFNKRQPRWPELLMMLPSFMWLLVFFAIPTLIIFAFAFKPSDMYGGIKEGWTLENFYAVMDPNYLIIIWRTVWLSLLTTFLCLLFALPTGYYLALAPPKWRRLLLLLIIMPFWSSFLVRIFAWKALLHPEGLIKKSLVFLHLINPDTSLLYQSSAVLLVMVYTYLPFAILPIYAAAEKFNFHLFEAAMDLGASRLTAFFKIFIPGIQRGIITALVMVFIPAMGAYVIPDIVGGTQSEMIGNKIAQRTFVDRNLPQASMLSLILSLAILLPMIAIIFAQTRSKIWPSQKE